MLRFFSLRISDRRQETPSAVSFAFDVPMRWRQHFRFAPGQYVTLRARIDGREVRRAYSICSGASGGELRIAIKRVEGGLFSNYACDHFMSGQMVEIMPPHGRFTAAAGKSPVHYAACAAGSGITPILSILKSTMMSEADSKFTLFYGNRSMEDCLFHEELAELVARYGARLTVIHTFSRHGAKVPDKIGRVDALLPELIREHITDPAAVGQWFVCGPNPMMMATKEILVRSGVQPEAIMMESFDLPAGLDAMPEGIVLNAVVCARIFGQMREIRPGAATIADAAIAGGIELPYSCRTGVCAMCKARVIEGRARMPADTILSDDDIAAGFILTCRSHAMSETMIIDCDVD